MSSQEIVESMNRWLTSFSEKTSNNICSLYDEQASLWGTLSPIKRDNSALIKDYFDHIFKYQSRYVKVKDSNIRLFGDMAIGNGQYTFGWIKEGVEVTTVARFSFVYIKKNGEWFIVEHHSSVMPMVT